MGCDYYIEKSLYINFKESYDTSYITLERNSGYFYDISFDEDDPKYDKEYNKMIKDDTEVNLSFSKENFSVEDATDAVGALV